MMMGPTAAVHDGGGLSASPEKVERNNNSIESVDVGVRGDPSTDDVVVEVICLEGNHPKVVEKNNNSIKHLELEKINHVKYKRGRKKEFVEINLDEIKYIDENVDSECVEVDLDGVVRVEETDLDKE